MSRGATLSHFLGPDYEIRSVRLLNGWILGVGGAPAAVGLGLLVVVLLRRR